MSLTTPLIAACADATTGSNTANPKTIKILPMLSTVTPNHVSSFECPSAQKRGAFLIPGPSYVKCCLLVSGVSRFLASKLTTTLVSGVEGRVQRRAKPYPSKCGGARSPPYYMQRWTPDNGKRSRAVRAGRRAGAGDAGDSEGLRQGASV